MYETTIKGFKIRLTNSLRDGLLKEWDPEKVEQWGDSKTHILKKEECILCVYSEKHPNTHSCGKCPLFGFQRGKNVNCEGVFKHLLGNRANHSLGTCRVVFQHTLKTSRRYVQKIRDTILAMKKV